MYKRISALTFLLLISIQSVMALDLNETSVIITEATEATYQLQNKFNSLVNETVEHDNSQPSISEEIFEVNKTNQVKVNTSKENNQSISLNKLNLNLGTSKEGLRIFKTRIRPYCELNGDKFAKQYMQEDWDDIYHDKEFKMEVIKACPKIEKRYKDSWTPHLYQFTIEYASDSDAIPEC